MDDTKATQLVWQHVTKIATCMLVTYDGGMIHARPMRGIAKPDQNTIWFFTDRGSLKQAEIAQIPRCCLTYADLENQTFVSLSGTMSPVHDRSVIDSLWSEGVELYFPTGKQDPQVLLLKFQPEFGEYWDSPSNPILLAIKFVESKVTGERPELGTTGSASFT